MLLSVSRLIGLPVKTKNGQFLGRIKDLEIDPNNFTVVKYLVVGSGWLKKFFVPTLVIDKSQVIEITAQAMIVVDGLIDKGAIVGEAV